MVSVHHRYAVVGGRTVRYALYVQDYGAPVGWRLALRRPEAITAIVTQNGNAYTAGFVGDAWEPFWAYAADPNPRTAGGRNDEIFGPAGAEAFGTDLPGAEVHLLDGGHFLLESELDSVAALMTEFLGRTIKDGR